MFSWINKYYKICPIWMILIFNLILVMIMSPIPLFGSVFTFGMSVTEPTQGSKVIGMLIFAVIPIGVFLSNLFLYLIVKTIKYPDEKQFQKIVYEEDTKGLLIKLSITVLVILLGFAAMYMFDDLWMFVNGWWF